VQPAEAEGTFRRDGQHDEALAPVAFFAARRIADDARAVGVALFQGEARQAGDDGLKLIVIGRAIHRKGNQAAQRAVGLGQVADAGAALGGQRLQPQRLPGRGWIALHQHALLMKRTGLLARGQSAPTAAAEGVVEIETELGIRAEAEGLDEAGKAGFGRSVQLPFTHPRVFEAVPARLPGLRPVQHQHTNAAHAAEVVEPSGQRFGLHRAGVIPQDRLAGDRAFERLGRSDWRLERQVGEGAVYRPAEFGGACGARAFEHNDAQIGPAAGCEINRENGHRPNSTSAERVGQWRDTANPAECDAIETVNRNGTRERRIRTGQRAALCGFFSSYPMAAGGSIEGCAGFGVLPLR